MASACNHVGGVVVGFVPVAQGKKRERGRERGLPGGSPRRQMGRRGLPRHHSAYPVTPPEVKGGEKQEFILDSPKVGLYIPKMCWRMMQYSHNAVQMCIASQEYDEKDYIRDYQEFLK